ncbi:hypothetical protein AAC387_Pa01g0698 [Persea americana]
MGAGKRTQTIIINERTPSSYPTTMNSSTSARNLRKSDLGGVIFGCKHQTMAECLSNQLFGLPGAHFSYVRNIEPGLPLFLFNYSDRKLHGIFESASKGQMLINPYGWSENGTERTPYPAQVRICVRTQCQPLQEKQFGPIIRDNFYTANHFWFELDHSQADHLLLLFTSTSKGGLRVNLPSHLPHTWQSSGNASCSLEPSGRTGPFFHSKEESADWGQANQYEALGWDDASYNGHGNSNKSSSSGGDFNLADLKSEVPDIDPTKLDIGCSSSIPCFDGESTLEAHSEEIEENDDLVSSKLVEFVANHECQSECSNDDPPSPGKIQEDDGQLVLSPSITSVKDGMILPTSSDLHREIAVLREGIQELKCFQMEQLRWNIALQDKLMESNLLTQQLRSRVVELESRCQSTSCVGESSNVHNLLQPHPEGLIYLIGGYDGTSWLAGLDSYSPSNDKLIPLKPMSTPRSYACATALDGDIYVIGGGINGDTWFNTVERYSPTTDIWTPCPPLSKRKGSLAGATTRGRLFAIGGGNGCECFSDVEMFDPVLGRWINNPSMFQERFAAAAAEVNGVIYAVGGYDGKEYLKSAERFDPREASWTRIPSMSTRRGCHSLAVLDEKLYAMGGFDGERMVSSVEVFDPRVGCWRIGDPMNSNRGYAATAVLGHSVYALGGVEVDKILLDTVECYKENAGWQRTNLRGVGKRCFFSAIVL